MDPNAVLTTICYAGQILLESGAETYRVEETMVRIAESFRVGANSFVTPTGIMFSVTYEGKNYTKIVRIRNRAIDLHKIDLVNDLSRSINEMTDLKDVDFELHRIRNLPTYAPWINVLFSGLSASGFAMFFKGSPEDWFYAFFIGSLLSLMVNALNKRQVNTFFINAISTAAMSLIVLIIWKLQIIQNYDAIIISVIMLLVPGIAITNSLRDYVAGDLTSGVARFTEAFLIALSIAAGTGFAFTIWKFFTGAF